MNWIGIDNGVSGSIGVISPCGTQFFKTPVKKCLDYTKKKSWCNRIDVVVLDTSLTCYEPTQCVCYIERPMVNPKRFVATKSALRALEATLLALESLKIPYQFIDSKEWQKALLPSGLKGEELKTASLEVGKRLFPFIDFTNFKDADGLLIAEYVRRMNH